MNTSVSRKSRPDRTPRRGNGHDGGRPSLADSVALCRADADFAAALGALYAAADAAAAARGLTCKACGACCDFTRTGHRLYVSSGELGQLTHLPLPMPPRRGRCPYQLEGKCTARRVRPLGCRLFFCEPASLDWSGRTYETYHGRIRHLHAARGLPYAYVELTAALEELFPTPRH